MKIALRIMNRVIELIEFENSNIISDIISASVSLSKRTHKNISDIYDVIENLFWNEGKEFFDFYIYVILTPDSDVCIYKHTTYFDPFENVLLSPHQIAIYLQKDIARAKEDEALCAEVEE